jgi:Protein of unknown function (DUF3307)
MVIVTLLFALLVSHALFDFPLQGEATAINKNPDANTELQKHVPWYYWMTSHALLHGGGVALVTGSIALGIAETVCHFFIDLGKCKNYFSIHQDQLLHFLCKVIWVGIILLSQ